MSDLHMGGEWSLDIRLRQEEFLKTLAKIADYYVHSIVLLGDIFEMWMTPMAVTPPALKEFIKKWRSDVVSWCKGVPRASYQRFIHLFIEKEHSNVQCYCI